jgi:hypothetical protein
LRFFAALEGGIWGGAIAAAAIAAAIAIGRSDGSPAWEGAAPPILLGLGGVLVGAVARAVRRIPLARCARTADAALDGQDRVLSAFCLEQHQPSALVAALVANALGAASRLVPGCVVPARRPKGLPALGLATVALCGAAVFPVSSRAARTPRPLSRAVGRATLAAGVIDVEREEASAALAEAGWRGDDRLAALGADFDRIGRGLSNGTIGDGQALDRLRTLEARAAEAAREAERDRRAVGAAARALGENAQTRAAGQALAAGDEGASARASAALGASASAQPKETGRALAAAARGVAESSSEANGSERSSGPRRLARDAAGAGVQADQIPIEADGSSARRLEQLERNLNDTAATCLDGDPSCRARAEKRAADLARLGQQAAAADGLRRLERAAGQMHARLARGELHDSDAIAARNFGRAANGQRTGLRDGTDHAMDSDDPAAGEPSSSAEAAGDAIGTDEVAAASQGEGAGTRPGDGTGDGIGKQPGADPLGRRDDTPTDGKAIEAHLPSGAGPTRGAVIGAAADRGFAARSYARVFTDYAAAIEDALGATAVPEGKRFIVRRYFDLIRPRSTR